MREGYTPRVSHHVKHLAREYLKTCVARGIDDGPQKDNEAVTWFFGAYTALDHFGRHKEAEDCRAFAMLVLGGGAKVCEEATVLILAEKPTPAKLITLEQINIRGPRN
jgi:hypothetical protein